MKVPTVSQIISFSKDKQSVERLKVWKEKNTTVSKTYRETGTSFSVLVNNLFKGKHIDENHGNEFFNSSLTYLNTIKDVSATEMNVEYLSDMPFKGRLDLLSKTTLVEFKTRNSQKPIHEAIMRDYSLQVAAYMLAIESMGHETKKMSGQICLIYKDTTPLTVPIDDMYEWKLTFKELLEKYYDAHR